MSRLRNLPLAAVVIAAAACQGCSSSSAASPNWQLAWSDEFDGPALDGTKWSVDTGDSFGTGQQDYDTGRSQNIGFDGGSLVLTARQESYMGAAYTSGRIETNGRFSQQYGRFEARIQVPQGQGLWPAFWLLGDNYTQVGWPQCGELDIMELRGATPTTVLGSMHGPGGDSYTEPDTLPGGASFAAGYHVFAIEWSSSQVSWYVDDQLYETQSADMLPASQPWVFDHPFFVILDLALGGSFGGPVGSATPFPQSMRVDYVRVYTDANNGG
jgi:beta-glucanase (GH16 family)